MKTILVRMGQRTVKHLVQLRDWIGVEWVLKYLFGLSHMCAEEPGFSWGRLGRSMEGHSCVNYHQSSRQHLWRNTVQGDDSSSDETSSTWNADSFSLHRYHGLLYITNCPFYCRFIAFYILFSDIGHDIAKHISVIALLVHHWWII